MDTRTSSETVNDAVHKQAKNEMPSAQQGRASNEREIQPKKTINKTKITITKNNSSKKGATATAASSNIKKVSLLNEQTTSVSIIVHQN